MAFFHLLLLFILSFSSNSYAQSLPFTVIGEYCNDTKMINPTTHISVNIDIVLKKLITTTPINGYGVAAAGIVNGVDRVYGLAQCRGDINTTTCLLCIQDAAKQIRQLCPDQADSRIWNDPCFLRYDTDVFYGQLDTSNVGGSPYYNSTDVNEQVDVFEKKLGHLMEKLEKKAVVPSNKGFANGKVKVSPVDSIYAVVQCGRDLSPQSCAQCLSVVVQDFGGICDGKRGCRSFSSSCYVRYELYPFLDIVSDEIEM